MKHIKFLAVFLSFSCYIFALTANEENLFKAVADKNVSEVSNILANSTDININIFVFNDYTSIQTLKEESINRWLC